MKFSTAAFALSITATLVRADKLFIPEVVLQLCDGFCNNPSTIAPYSDADSCNARCISYQGPPTTPSTDLANCIDQIRKANPQLSEIDRYNAFEGCTTDNGYGIDLSVERACIQHFKSLNPDPSANEITRANALCVVQWGLPNFSVKAR